MGFVWYGSGGLWCGDCCLIWWRSAWSCGGCEVMIGFNGGFFNGFFFFFLGLLVYMRCFGLV